MSTTTTPTPNHTKRFTFPFPISGTSTGGFPVLPATPNPHASSHHARNRSRSPQRPQPPSTCTSTPRIPEASHDDIAEEEASEDEAQSTHYTILQLPPTASQQQIKQSYRTLRTDYFSNHPRKYRKLQEAYLVLVDDDARRSYDAALGLGLGHDGSTATGLLTPPREAGDEGKEGGGVVRVRTIVDGLNSHAHSLLTSPLLLHNLHNLHQHPHPLLSPATTAGIPSPTPRDPNYYLKHSSKAASASLSAPCAPASAIPVPAFASASSGAQSPSKMAGLSPRKQKKRDSVLSGSGAVGGMGALAAVKHQRRQSMIPVFAAAAVGGVRGRADTMV